jgi:hypothetical protein
MISSFLLLMTASLQKQQFQGLITMIAGYSINPDINTKSFY